MTASSSLRHASAAAVVLVGAACLSGCTEPEISETTIAAFSGSGQSGTVGQTLADPITVRVSRDGAGLSGRVVSWTVTAGGGSVEPTSSVSGAEGLAFTIWTLGPNVGNNVVEASVSGATGPPAVFSATGAPATTAR